jgi:hypothetical protein
LQEAVREDHFGCLELLWDLKLLTDKVMEGKGASGCLVEGGGKGKDEGYCLGSGAVYGS